MRIAVLSDVHGNLPALEAVLADLKDFSPRHILFAGDFTRGPHPNEVIDRLRELDTLMIRGNDDRGPLRYVDRQVPQEWRTFKQFGMLRWTVNHLSARNLAFLRELPEQRVVHLPGADSLRLVHGSPDHPARGLDPVGEPAALDQALNGIAEVGLVCAHTHRQWAVCRKGRLAVNPGAVAGTQIGPRAQYARLEWDGRRWQVDLRTVDYDTAPLRAAFEASGLLAEGGMMALGFLLSMETGHDHMMAFFHFASKLAGQAGCPAGQAIPDEIWDRATGFYRSSTCV